MKAKIRAFFAMEFQIKLLCLEAFFCLGWARLLMVPPFSRIAPSLGASMQETTKSQRMSDIVTLLQIHDVIGMVSKYTLWDSKCLVRAIGGMKMLERRNMDSTLYLGVTKDENGQFIAHAWLRSGSFVVTGAEKRERFTVVGMFAKKGRDMR